MNTKRLLTILMVAVLVASTARAAVRVTATITCTNNTETGDSFVVNTDSRYWTNTDGASWISTNAAGGTNVSAVATNLFNQISLYPYTGPVVLQWSATNAIRLVAQIDQALTVTATGEWATITYSTQTGVRTFSAIWPHDNIYYATNRTNQASDFAKALSDYSTNAISPLTTLASNLVSLITTQTVAGPKTWTGSNVFTGNVTMSNLLLRGASSLSATVGNLTNGYWTNAILDGATATNFSPRGLGPGTILLGSSAGALYSGDVAIGDYSVASGGMGVAMGYGAQVTATNGVAIGGGAEVSGAYSTSVGRQSGVGGLGSIAIGYSAVANGTNSILIGQSTTMTATNTVQLGSSSQSVSIPGVVTAPTVTNTLWRGTNRLDGDLSLPVKTVATLANGPNSLSLLGTNSTYIRFTGIITSNSSIVGITGGRDGRALVCENATGYILTLANESGLESTAGSRIVTPVNYDIAVPNGGWFRLMYDSSESRWNVSSAFPTTVVATNYAIGVLRMYDITNRYVLVADTWLTITNWTSSTPSTNVTVSTATGTITVQQAGIYHILGTASFSGIDVGGDNYELGLFAGDGTVSMDAESYTAATSADRHNATCFTYKALTNGEVVTLRINSEVGDDVDVLGAQLNMHLIRP